MTLESVERILEWTPISFVDRITPRPLLIVTTAGHDVVHPAAAVAEAYERAREPKRLDFLPFDQLGLYSEPGLSVSHPSRDRVLRRAPRRNRSGKGRARSASPAEEVTMPSAVDDLFSHRPLTDDAGWFDRFYMNVHSAGADVTLSLGMGRYPQAGVVDGFAILVEPGGQRNFRASREATADERRLEAGPLSAEVVEPLRRWRLRLGENEAEGLLRLRVRSATSRRSTPGTSSGARARRVHCSTGLTSCRWAACRGDSSSTAAVRELTPDSWFGASRPLVGNPSRRRREAPPNEAPSPTAGRHDWVLGRVGDRAVFYLLSGGGSRGPHLLGAGLPGPRASEGHGGRAGARLGRAGRFRGARASLRTETGDAVELTARAPAATIYLRGGLYGGWHGLSQGMRARRARMRRRALVDERPTLLAEVAGLNDHLCRFESESGNGFGIYEVASGM